MNAQQISDKIKLYADGITGDLLDFIPVPQDGQRDIVRAMKYSIRNGGKRIRPILVYEFCKACGGSVDKALPFAVAIEFIHTYSLIHDDLPCMDDDDMRRGQPSCHKMFGEATALLAGDALLTMAFEAAASAELDGDTVAQAVSLLAQNAGVGGMIGGQALDLMYESKVDPTLNELLTVHKLKTGALISAACLLGCLAAGADRKKLAAASGFAYNLGIAFQIKDDILDVTGDEAALGKRVGSDAQNNKTTYVSMVGLEKAQRDVEALTNKAIEFLGEFENTEFLKDLAEYLVSREN